MTGVDTDVLIVGAGIAGLITALTARGRRVCILTPDVIAGGGTASECALGGLAAAVGANDSPALHLEDTMRAGGSLNSVPAAHLACREAPMAVEYLDLLGVPFARVDGLWSLHREAAHGRARVLHAGDRTGAAIMRTLRQRIAEAPHVELLPRVVATRLLLGSGGVCGVVARDHAGRSFAIHARDVVIATGGVGGLFSRSTNPPGSRGDGPAMAIEAGARCASLEFVQFHPTALDVDERPLPLLTEALRGAGARLVDDAGTRIMRDVHALAELAPRDVVARAIYSTQRAGRRVWLDATRLDADFAAHFPAAFALCRAHGIDPRRQPIPVTPAAHYHMGGIAVDLDGRTSVPRLWAVGEAACTGMHGANRLASNSLLEAVVYGRRLGRALGFEPRETRAPPPSNAHGSFDLPDSSFEHELRQLMWRCMGIVRDASLLAQGLHGIARLRERIPVDATLLRSRLLLAERMLLSASHRRVSCGAHYRSDAEKARTKRRPAMAC